MKYSFLLLLFFPCFHSSAQTIEYVFQDGMEELVALESFSGTYEIKSKVFLGESYPRRLTDQDPRRSGDNVDTIVAFFSDPPADLTASILAVPNIDTNLVDPDQAANLLQNLLADVLFYKYPDLSPAAFAVIAADVADLMNQPTLTGSLIFATEPNALDAIPNSMHRVNGVEFTWNYPCLASPDNDCSPKYYSLMSLTGNSFLNIESAIEPVIVGRTHFSVPPYLHTIPYNDVFFGVINSLILPNTFPASGIGSLSALISKWLTDWMVDYYNSEGFNPVISCVSCTCEDSSLAIEALYASRGGNALDAETLSLYACGDGGTAIDTRLHAAIEPGLTPSIGATVWQTATDCKLTDITGDLAVNLIGPNCSWTTRMLMENFDMLTGTAAFGTPKASISFTPLN